MPLQLYGGIICRQTKKEHPHVGYAGQPTVVVRFICAVHEKSVSLLGGSPTKRPSLYWIPVSVSGAAPNRKVLPLLAGRLSIGGVLFRSQQKDRPCVCPCVWLVGLNLYFNRLLASRLPHLNYCRHDSGLLTKSGY